VSQAPFSVRGGRSLSEGQRPRDAQHGSIRGSQDGNNVVVNLDKLYQEDDDEAAWKAAFVAITE
jgi:hypothetical protein